MSDQPRHHQAPARVPPPSPPPASRLVHLSHTAFMVTAHVWRQLRFLLLRRLLHHHERVPRLAWLFFLVAKASLSSPADCSLTVSQAYNLLLACLMQSGLIVADDPEHAIFRATCAVPSELQHYRRALHQLLHKRIRARLPFFPCSHTALEAHCHALDAAYSQQLTNIKHSLATDERIFLHAPQLVAVTTPPLSPPVRRSASNPAASAAAFTLTPPKQLPHCHSPTAPAPARAPSTPKHSPHHSPPPRAANQTCVSDQCAAQPLPANTASCQRSSPPSTPVHQRKRLLHDPDCSASTPRPRRRRRAADYAVTPSSARPPTPARRARARSALLTPLSSPTFSRYAVTTRPDALDALATVAAVTPHCATTLPHTPPSANVPHTPLTDSSRSVRWIRSLTEKRPETQSESCLKCALEQVPTSDCLRSITGGGRALHAIIDVGRRFSDALCDVLKDLNSAQYKREALAVYFAAMEGILAKEHRRLSRQPEKFSSNVLHNYILHKSFLTFAWETTVAAYGRRDLHVFTVAYRAFNVSPFELTKALDAFCTLVPQIPRCLVNHLICCDARILEWMAWRHDSPLVRVLQAYSRDRVRQQQCADCSALSVSKEVKDSDGNSKLEQPSPVTPQRERSKCNEKGEDEQGAGGGGHDEKLADSNSIPKLKDMERPERLYRDNEARARVLDFFYEKVFALAGTRTEELLRRLELTTLRMPVWRSIKYALWCRWNLVINRHVDLIILCVIYGVAKVRHMPLQFRQIVWHYNRLDHTNDATFLSNSPAVFRNIVLDDFGQLLEDGSIVGEMQGANVRKGDIIRFYNEAFVPHMRDFMLPMGVEAANGARPQSEEGVRGCDVVKKGKKESDGSDDVEGLNELAQQASRRHGREREEMFEDLGRKLLQSPMRVMKSRRSPIRIGSIVVSPMSPSTRNMVLSRQNSVRRSGGEGVGVMTPGTRTLFAFGESPMRSASRSSTTVDGRRAGREERRRYAPLSFDGPVAFERSAAVRRQVQEVIGRSGRAASEEMEMRSSGEESGSDECGDREEMEMGV
eukprot:TRINITY_DN48095_c0_g1_i1.p1 TRINITY_DN48095_c0_g1~~TRINITY_DN48095_c0_g1_i1.p1  ORF type:complete len:1178 (+),score=215.31 TRINITY_DN48095_c0_g1_i1:419-3535(+)